MSFSLIFSVSIAINALILIWRSPKAPLTFFPVKATIETSNRIGRTNSVIYYPRKDSIMTSVKISLNSIDKVKNFVNDITRFDSDFDLVSGRYVIDAKSIMGIFSLDLSKPINLNIHSEKEADAILKTLEPYIIG
jgi:phosphotransferase system HPr-like phosphotransfer protein